MHWRGDSGSFLHGGRGVGREPFSYTTIAFFLASSIQHGAMDSLSSELSIYQFESWGLGLALRVFAFAISFSVMFVLELTVATYLNIRFDTRFLKTEDI